MPADPMAAQLADPMAVLADPKADPLAVPAGPKAEPLAAAGRQAGLVAVWKGLPARS